MNASTARLRSGVSVERTAVARIAAKEDRLGKVRSRADGSIAAPQHTQVTSGRKSRCCSLVTMVVTHDPLRPRDHGISCLQTLCQRGEHGLSGLSATIGYPHHVAVSGQRGQCPGVDEHAVNALTQDIHAEREVANTTAFLAPVPCVRQRAQWRAELWYVRCLYRTLDAKTRAQRRTIRSGPV